MTTVFFSVTVTLDGFMAPHWRSDEQWMAEWMRMQDYAFHQQFLRQQLQLGEGGETGEDNRILEATVARTGASIMGKRMFDFGARAWPEEAPFHTPVFVVTHETREPWKRPGGTVFHFVNDGIHSALARARDAAGDRDVRIAGGVSTVQQYLDAGLVDEFHLAVAPVLQGSGMRVFDRFDPSHLGLDILDATRTPRMVHLRYGVTSAA